MKEKQPDNTESLIRNAQQGDLDAAQDLMKRYLERLRRWAHGRLPRQVRGHMDTEDVVQETALKTLRLLDSFQSQGPAAFQGYIRRALNNQLRDQYRVARERPEPGEFESADHAAAADPQRDAMVREALARCDEALLDLSPRQQVALVARLEFGASHAEIAQLLGFESADAARMSVTRARKRLLKAVDGASDSKR